ncbi:MAG: prefoldin subunit [Candidatus Micrarchaeia archaeon]
MEEDKLEKLSKDYQLLQEQMQSLALQREQFRLQKEEYKEALEELEKAQGKVYMAIGGIMVETTKEEAKKGIEEKASMAEMRLGIVTKQYEEIAKKEQDMRTQINNLLKELKQ